MTWRDPPQNGDVYRSSSPQETRHVIDRNYGGDVFYVSGRWYYGAPQQQVTEAEWNEWAKRAKFLRKDP